MSTHQAAEFFRGEFLRLKEEIAGLDNTMLQVMPTFHLTFSDQQWPYELSSDPPEYPTSYSFSTVSMVCHAIFEWIELVKVAALSKRDRSTADELSKSLKANAEAALEKLCVNVLSNFNSRARLSSSNSFGDNDPFTLFWLVSCISSSSNSSKNDEVVDRIILVTKQLLKRVEKFETILSFGDKRTVGTDHAFVFLYLIRTVKLLQEHSGFARVRTDAREMFRESEQHFHRFFDKVIHRQMGASRFSADSNQ